ncbi:hypothetical protein [Streptomyces sp. B1I3]|uniref:hypothetical protein n=1 Tax=Streptomyces sp. B1I3 TaxID=3042264 RepID=UPI00278798ED|nr:hypothetical protein [Streptomyces sp. B1I3]MDQ0794569.1 hypothetical protein [Streptomyces sp. B1I3]
MGEGEKGSRQANGSSGAAPRQRRPSASDVGEDGEMPPGDLARLLAAVGVLLGSHAASDLVVMPRAELERREYAAYGQGWRDAAAQYHRPAEWADGLPATDAGDRTPGQAAVIPFRRRIPHGTQGAHDDARRDVTDPAGTAPSEETLAGPAHPAVETADTADPTAPETARPGSAAPAPAGPGTARPAPAAPDLAGSAAPGPATPMDPAPSGPAKPKDPAPPGPGSTGPASGDPAPADGARPEPPAPARPRSATPSRPPAFAPKSRRSKVPTIPRLPRPRRQARPDEQD